VDLPLADGTSPPHKVVESQLAEVGLLLEDEDSSETMQLCSGGAMQIRAGEIPVPVVHAGNRSASRYSGVSYFWLGTSCKARSDSNCSTGAIRALIR